MHPLYKSEAGEREQSKPLHLSSSLLAEAVGDSTLSLSERSVRLLSSRPVSRGNPPRPAQGLWVQ